MSSIAHALTAIRAAYAALGAAELSRRSGVPYTTLKDWAARDFVGPQIENLQKLADVAEDPEARAPVGSHHAPEAAA